MRQRRARWGSHVGQWYRYDGPGRWKNSRSTELKPPQYGWNEKGCVRGLEKRGVRLPLSPRRFIGSPTEDSPAPSPTKL